MSTRKRFIALIALAGLLFSACSDGGTETGDEPPATEAPAAETAAPTTTEPPPTVPVDQYVAEAESIAMAPDDRSLPPEIPAAPAGSYGFSRYVFQQEADEVVPTLIEGPRGQQVRCQSTDELCSYNELRELYESGDPVPDYLGMDREELGELVSQLQITEAAVNEYNTIEEACAAGFRISSAQNANMGIHAQNPNGISSEFDPARPQMVLYAREGGELLTQAEQGVCRDGEWTGDPGYTSVGAVFTLPMTEEHPDAFAGPIDNWHIHLNTCAGSPEEGGEESDELDGGTLGSRERCEASGGFFLPVISTWMMHAYVDQDFDSQGGVFAMFNPGIWPLSDPASLEERRIQDVEGALTAPINNFDFGDVVAEAGEPVVFTNSDSVPHTVTSSDQATAAFDTGVFGTGQSAELVFDEAGAYEIFCVLHPGMTGTITVE